MHVKGIWRYPVKSMAGEQLQRAKLPPSGIEGGRIVQVQSAQGRTVTSRTYSELLGLRATLDERGHPLIDGRPWTGPGARLVHDESVDRFDILPLLVAKDGAIAEFGRDRRRLRPNVS